MEGISCPPIYWEQMTPLTWRKFVNSLPLLITDHRIPGTSVTIKAKDMVAIPVWSLHYDEKYWTDPKEFRPDRFLPENKDQIRSGTYLPFGLGPRNCIGEWMHTSGATVVLYPVTWHVLYVAFCNIDETNTLCLDTDVQYNSIHGVMERLLSRFWITFPPVLNVSSRSNTQIWGGKEVFFTDKDPLHLHSNLPYSKSVREHFRSQQVWTKLYSRSHNFNITAAYVSHRIPTCFKSKLSTKFFLSGREMKTTLVNE